MNREEALATWAPENSVWSPWTKAVLFSFMSEQIPDGTRSPEAAWDVSPSKNAALVVDLAGAKGVEVGISLAHSGYRPIPLYNACPYDSNVSAPSVIDVVPIMRALEDATDSLAGIALPPSAPPAFLLDANRHNAAFSPDAGWFDNRSIVRPSDLPSAQFLSEEGIQHVIIVQANRTIKSDLQTVLLAWQEAGMTIAMQAPFELWNPSIYTVPRPSFLKAWWIRFQQHFGYRLNSSGSFGRFVHGSGS